MVRDWIILSISSVFCSCKHQLIRAVCFWSVLLHFLVTQQVWLDVLTSSCGCFRRTRSQSCPFCRDSLKRVNSGDLWIYTSNNEIIDLSSITRQNLKRLFMYIDKLPLIVPEPMFVSYDPRYRWGSGKVCIKFRLLVYDSCFPAFSSTHFNIVYIPCHSYAMILEIYLSSKS
jgi:hypothetical protein